MAQQLSYKGMDVVIDFTDDDHAEAKIGKREFSLARHGNGLSLWACDDAYFMSDDPIDVIRHLIDYWYIIDSPDTAPPEGPHHGDVPIPPGGVLPARPVTTGDADHEGHKDHGSGSGAKKRGSQRSRRR